ncbi:thioredoxin-like protein [Tribonema minus]|uniref:thioredoxin-dependent peroxiredoxin n=1 Tax=Tribonema minus TaxID=303371 RepID=A0A835Z8Y3_9STRA|nr:thioredoxin-like protein [Tribonema minus]
MAGILSAVQGFVARSLPSVARSGAASLRMVKAGDSAPDFTLKDSAGKSVSLSSFKGKKNVVLFFFPKSDTPGCTKEACAFNAELPVFAKAGTEIIGISSDAEQAAFKAKYNLGMTLLADAGGAVRKLYNVPRSMFGALDGRVTYVIGKDGIVKKVHDNLIDAESHVSISKQALGI